MPNFPTEGESPQNFDSIEQSPKNRTTIPKPEQLKSVEEVKLNFKKALELFNQLCPDSNTQDYTTIEKLIEEGDPLALQFHQIEGNYTSPTLEEFAPLRVRLSIPSFKEMAVGRDRAVPFIMSADSVGPHNQEIYQEFTKKFLEKGIVVQQSGN